MPTFSCQCLQWKPPHLCLGSTSQLFTASSWGPPKQCSRCIIGATTMSKTKDLSKDIREKIVDHTRLDFGGLILDKTVSHPKFEGMAVFTPVINGVGGNLAAIQASRISTYLHFWSTPGILPYKMRQHWPNPCITFLSSGVNSRSARVLLMLVIPGHMVFLYAISLLQGEEAPISEAFIVCFLFAAMLQVTILLYVADLIIRLMWRLRMDPDNFSIPYLTAMGDLLGTGFLALCFHTISLVQSFAL